MAQHDYIIANQSGAAFRADLNNGLAAIVSQNSGTAQPSTTYAYQWWADTTTGLLKLRNSANNAWITLFQLDGEWTTLAIENGTAAAPSLYFKDSGTDTGLFSPGADQFGIATGGVERVEFGTSEVVFNDGGANYDFRIEGDTNASLFKIDAGLDQVQVANLNGGPLAGFRNRIINGDMRIDQRNAGAALVPAPINQYTVDRLLYSASQAGKYNFQQNAFAGTGPEGFPNYAGFVVASAYTASAAEFFSTSQRIEGFNISDLGWGTAAAKTVTLSFWVQSSLAGLHSGALVNGSFNRSYPYGFTIGAVNTWEYKTITIPGDTTGTWNATNGIGIGVTFNLGCGSDFLGTANAWAAANKSGVTGAISVVGTSGATFYITGVQLEPGPVATPFEQRPIGTELALCQRYFATLDGGSTIPVGNLTNDRGFFKLPTTMRVAPTCSFTYDVGSGATFVIGIDGAYQTIAHSSSSGFAVTASAEL